MSSAAFAALVPLPVVIDAPGMYLSREGQRVRIETVSTKHDFGCIGHYPFRGVGTLKDAWHKSGRLYFGMECRNDIVAKVPEEQP